MKKKTGKRFNLLDEYKKCLKYIHESRKFIYVILGIFLFFVLIGFFIPAPQVIYDKIIDFIKQILKDTEGMSQLDLIKFIIINNVKSTLFGILFGIAFGIFPLASAVVNGYLLGFVSFMSVNDGGILTLWKIFPHGIFELPAVFLSLALGLKLGMFVFQKKSKDTLRDYLINSIRVFILIILPLLIIAGIIEGILIFLIR